LSLLASAFCVVAITPRLKPNLVAITTWSRMGEIYLQAPHL
jgi:hypothetical protein